ncbi:forespore capture DNA-binding protein RefZ [Niallia sp. NCCP-28]|uniref:forespore capture DNA-binding protein RefZ n=1 Tax=Niallia sp. NCCP-28 TaxID=2934712 RepID=UPI00207FDAAB|nr:forespore capture DNA-binding protein RefZ [Niallia sp. NCCP-28]GKU81582.1 putative HTH-type transcriptional regulator YttP [Niallia sp. NCCP-28]
MKRNSKDSIIEAAITLFNRNGYDGTSIRDIASHAHVNVANISYYFNGKHGLLEYCFTSYFEKYLEKIEDVYRDILLEPTEKLKKIAESIIHFQCLHPHLTRFVLREVSIDSQVVREIMSTYYVKERFYLTKILEEGIEKKQFKKQMISYSIIQLKSLLSMPFLNAFYLTEVLHVYVRESYFAKKYLEEIYRWIDEVICFHKESLSIP